MEFDETTFMNLSLGYSISLLIIVIYSFYMNYCLFNKVIEVVKHIKKCKIVIQDYEYVDDETECLETEDEIENTTEDKEDDIEDDENIKTDTEKNNKIVDDQEDLMINNDEFVNILHNLVSTISKATETDKNNDKNIYVDKSES